MFNQVPMSNSWTYVVAHATFRAQRRRLHENLMSRGFFSASVAAARAAERQARAEQRARERHKRTVLRAEQDAARKATRLFHENQVAEADALTKEAQDRFRSLETILERTLNQHPAIVLTTLKRRLPHKPSPCGRPELDTFLPSKPSTTLADLVYAAILCRDFFGSAGIAEAVA